MLLSSALYGQQHAAPETVYAVVFGFVIDQNGDLKSFRVSKVIDPRSGSADPVAVEVPKTYISAARAQLLSKGYKATVENGELKETFTYFYYDPKQPHRADIEPRAKR